MSTDCLHIVVMGVSATGKSAVAQRLAEGLGLSFDEGDSYHSASSIAKMADGVPLTDADRLPWLRTLAGLIGRSHAAGTSSVLTCSALRRSYRDVLRSEVPDGSVFFVHLHADVDVLRDRMAERRKHFMPVSLLRSQLDTLEPLEPDESGAVVDVTPPLEDVVREAMRAIEDHSR